MVAWQSSTERHPVPQGLRFNRMRGNPLRSGEDVMFGSSVGGAFQRMLLRLPWHH